MGREFIDGNRAIARGALRAKCDFFASYPITPATTILQEMQASLPDNQGIAIQAEDEIAAIGFCIGASMAGRKVMTATSGPGMSLYSENIGLALMCETPLVIVDVQRQGPATGSATKGADSDILFSRWITSSGLPVIALCPATIEEAYELTYHAFNLAEKFRAPVIVLSNKEISMTRETVDLDRVKLQPVINRNRVLPDEAVFLPHAFTRPDEVPPFADFGGDRVTRHTTSTHDQAAYLTSHPRIIQEMIDHYFAKIDSAAEEIARVKTDFQQDAETLIISYGITSRSVAVAVREARSRGIKLSSLVLQTLWPTPEKAIRSAMTGVKKVVVPEMNMGQYRREIERLSPPEVKLVGVAKMNTQLLTPQEILEQGTVL
ncbi:MAG: pyruvate flavodoxin/ferredoxin oxidoreductase [Deltaproteobacteria bacterium]|nr:pyruvate flavodoxin/ferredoxin oxidoreductase [Deltaproteobacteria bacterium]